MSAQVRIAVVAICCMKQGGRPVSISFIIPFHPLTGTLAILRGAISSEQFPFVLSSTFFMFLQGGSLLSLSQPRARKDSKRTDLGLKELRIIWNPPAGILGDGDRS